MRGGPFGRVGLVLAVIAALAVGRVITDHVPVGRAAVAPFVTEGSMGEVVSLEYTDLHVERVRSAPYLVPATDDEHVVRAGGIFLVVDLTVTATTEPLLLPEQALVDTEGRRYLESDRAGCDASGLIPTGVPWQAMLCFDVPPNRLEGLRLRLGRGGPLDAGVVDTDRRDEVALIDLGIDARAAAELAAREGIAYRGFQGSFHESADLTEVTVQ